MYSTDDFRKYSDFAIAFSVHLGPSPSAALLVIPKFNTFVASSEYNDSYTPTKGDDGTELGLSAYRFVDDYPFTQCIKQAFVQV
ncbi:hypothetical protein AAVH_07788 [Aphelenchoides avenae]|nr:hypothetical protein AAVH_07788 [Aphelenchus avenae]